VVGVWGLSRLSLKRDHTANTGGKTFIPFRRRSVNSSRTFQASINYRIVSGQEHFQAVPGFIKRIVFRNGWKMEGYEDATDGTKEAVFSLAKAGCCVVSYHQLGA
jgi:hypothetical protein